MTTRDEAVTGGAELDRLLQTLPGKVQKNVTRAALRAGAAVLLREVRQRIPVDQGVLRTTSRISARNTPQEVQVSVKVGGKHKGVDGWYARLVEYGTRQHYIKVADVDRGRGRKRGTLATISTVNRRVLQIGANFVGPSVLHPGARAQPFMRPAVDAKFNEAIAAVTAKVRERLTREGLDSPPPLPVDPAE